MNRRVVVFGLALALMLVVGLIGTASKPPFWGEGARINVLSQEPAVITADQACWVRHGVTGLRFPGSQPDFKAETGNKKAVTAGAVTFELFINGEPIKLQVQRNAAPGDEPGTIDQPQHFYVQFAPYHFEPGVYEIVGVWTAKNPNNPLAAISPFIRVTTLTVLEP